jgi:hypothetical protein
MGPSAFSGSGSAPSTPLRAWRCARGLLVHQGPERSVGIDELLSKAGQSGYDSPSYLLVDPGGAVIETFSVTTWSAPGERGAAFHIVDSGCLLKVMVREVAGGAPVVATSPVLTGLDALPPGDVASQARAAAVLRTDTDPTFLLMSSPSRPRR